MAKRVVVGLSGGVDSSVAAYLLKEQGYDVTGLFMINWHDKTGVIDADCPWDEDVVFAELVAKKLDIPFHVVDLSKPYRERVIDYMFSEYKKGRTPNPDVLCNREIKFDAFLKAAEAYDPDFIATGHYCKKDSSEENGKPVYRLLAGDDPNKEQSYFLCQLSQEQLARTLFPIGHLHKPEVRDIARQQGLASADKKDSQGICFVGKVHLPVFLQQKLKAREGNIFEIPVSSPQFAIEKQDQSDLESISSPWTYTREDGTWVGKHQGAHFFTVGQRKGLNVGGKEDPL
ncbi:MAG: tRNA 2-thiouridine(34) synthase MnmA, partial [Bacteroidales bacterium]|nr:tRNA 2-thiouridine(34) synthase MnmA [Bacteroidales bacterium]